MILLLEAKGHDRLEKSLKAMTWDDLKDVPGLDKFDHSKTPWDAVLEGQLSYESEFDRTINDFLEGVAKPRILKGIYAIAAEKDPSQVKAFGNEKKTRDFARDTRIASCGPLCSFTYQGNGRVVYRNKNRKITLLAVGNENGSGGGVWEPVKTKGL